MKDYVRVSEILARFQDYKDIDPVVLEAKAKIGTNVHKAIIQDCADDFVVIETDRAQAYFESYKMWKDKNKESHIKQVDRLFCDDLMLTGECDGLLNSSSLIDWKCSATANKKIWNMQAHMYWYLLEVNGTTASENMLWVNLRHDKHVYGKKVSYTPKSPICYEFKLDESVLTECLNEVRKYWEEKSSALCVD